MSVMNNNFSSNGNNTASRKKPSQPPPPEQRYLEGERLGAGGLGIVFHGVDEHLQRPVALKKPKLTNRNNGHQETADSGIIDRFVQEARITARLQHPGIVPVHDSYLDKNQEPVFVMRVIKGKSLHDKIKNFHDRNPDFRSKEFLQLLEHFTSLCNTIAFAHSEGFLHRDIKPENVLVGQYGETMMIDWGLAREKSFESNTPIARGADNSLAAAGTPPLTQDGTFMGTPAYMSPEQVHGESLGKATDVYSLGAILYFMLTRKCPKQSASKEELLDEFRDFPNPPAPKTLNSRVPVGLNFICMKALSNKPCDRFKTAKGIAYTINCWKANDAIPGLREPWLKWETYARRFRKYQKLTVGTLVAVIVSVLFSVIFSVVVLDRNSRILAEKDRADQSLRIAFEAIQRLDQVQSSLVFRESQQSIRKAANESIMQLEDQLIAIRENDQSVQDLLAIAHLRKGQRLNIEGKPDEAYQEFQTALRKFESSQPKDSRTRSIWVNTLISLGALHWEKREKQKAFVFYEKAKQLCDQFLSEQSDPELKSIEADLAYRLAFFNVDSPAQRDRLWTLSVGIYNELLLDPQAYLINRDFVLRKGRNKSHQEMALAEQDLTKREELQNEVEKEWKSLIADNVSVITYRDEYAEFLNNSAALDTREKNVLKAIPKLEEARKQLEPIVLLDPANLRRKYLLAVICTSLGQNHLITQSPGKALPHLQRAESLLLEICATAKPTVIHLAQAGRTSHWLLVALSTVGEVAQANHAFGQGICHWIKLSNIQLLEGKDRSYVLAGVKEMMRYATGNYEVPLRLHSLQNVRDASECFRTDSQALLKISRDLSRSLPLDKPTVDEAARNLALDLLAKAVESGFKDRPIIETDPAFRPLHQNPRFSEIVRSIP